MSRFAIWRHSAILIFRNLDICHVPSIAMLFCFIVQYFTEIGQYAELWTKTILKMAAVHILEFKKKFNFGHVTVSELQISCCVPNFIGIGTVSLKYCDFTIFKMANVRHLEFYESNKKYVLSNSESVQCNFFYF